MISKIDFLGIGAQKAATSWLWNNLRLHPDVWMPPRKELHYFDRAPKYPSPSHLASNYLFERLLGKEYYNKNFRNLLAREVKALLLSKDLGKLMWYLQYYLGTYSDEWYLSLFRGGRGKVTGEITPSYSILDKGDVEHIYQLLPDLKIILILRNPIERAWSYVRFRWTTGKFDRVNDISEIKRLIDSRGQVLRSDYVRTLQNWGAFFSGKQLNIIFYEDVLRKPHNLILGIFDFLGVDKEKFEKLRVSDLNKRYKKSLSLDLPEDIQVYLASKYYPELQKLSELLGSYADTWLSEAESILG
jgi:hypothetical protein